MYNWTTLPYGERLELHVLYIKIQYSYMITKETPIASCESEQDCAMPHAELDSKIKIQHMYLGSYGKASNNIRPLQVPNI